MLPKLPTTHLIWCPIGLDYQLMPGLMPYIEWNAFRYRTPIPTIESNIGGLLLFGAEVQF